MSGVLPVHGFVLAGGKSSRMGQDKALLHLRGQPMVEIAVEKLRSFCAAVSIVGERDDLSRYAQVVRGERAGLGPAAGIEAGLRACAQPWAMFLPVDVPLLPSEVLQGWVEVAISAGEGANGAYLVADARVQPAICVLRTGAVEAWRQGVEGGERRLDDLLRRVGATRVGLEAPGALPGASPERLSGWLRNVNTPEDLVEAEGFAAEMDRW